MAAGLASAEVTLRGLTKRFDDVVAVDSVDLHVAAGEFIDSATLVDRLRRGRFVLLGEKHDNPDHHRLQAWLLRALIAAGRRPKLGFEMFTADDAPAIARQLAAHPTDAVGLAEAVNWQRSGWPDWAMYQQIAEAA